MDEIEKDLNASAHDGAAKPEETTDEPEAAEQMGRLRELVEFLKASGIAEFDLEREGLKLRLKFQGAPGVLPVASAPSFDMAQLATMMGSAQAAAPIAAAPAIAQPAAAVTAEAPATKNHIVKSPLVGTIYEASSPGAAPFVKVGDVVEVGTVLCIVEAMKLMNEIESDAAGEIVARIVPSGQPVEYGQPLFEIKAL